MVTSTVIIRITTINIIRVPYKVRGLSKGGRRECQK